ncbi:glycine zipper 2TM domain-containing protein [Sneathiella chinensis]|uniref:17 kDa surface antigen n=1 Tax=Sneathiella chinensis TaxID=349750 RepID=A0ABQ5U0R2_9PROT|nr:glycine zipper 2TM domain-containing protein [Sneathiella chinensis]GLQ05408.1 hypothetical protein GCM10007924_06290 [Sneathiella chinensis]
MSKKAVAALLISTAVLSGCQTTNSGETFGTVLGAVGGAIIGAQFGKGAGQLVGTAIGTLAGAYIGNQLGKILDEQEQAAVEAETATALEKSEDGQKIVWNSPKTGAEAEIQTVNTRQETKTVTLYRDRRISEMPPLTLLGEEYHSLKSSNIRKSPSTDAEIVGSLQEQERFNAVGRVEGKPWIVVAKNNRTVGFVYEPLVEKAPAAATVAEAAPTPAIRNQSTFAENAAKLEKEGKGQDSLGEPIDLDAEGLIAEEVQVATTCRDLEVTSKKGDKQGQDSFTACKATDGAWEIL